MTDADTTDAPKRRGRPPKATTPAPGDANFKPNHRGPMPHFPVYGDSWMDVNGVVKWWHGNGFYIEPPGKPAAERAEELGKAAVAEMDGPGAFPAMKGSAAAADAAGPDAERVEPETVVGEIVDEDPLGIGQAEPSAVAAGDDAQPRGEVVDNSAENSSAVAHEQFAPIDDDDEELPAVAKIEELAADFEISELRYIVADARDLVLGMIKEMPKLWGALPEAKQYDLARGLENGIAEMVQRIAEAVASQGTSPIACILESYAEKDGIKIALKLKPASEAEECSAILGLHKAKGGIVMLTAASTAEFAVERRAQTDPDEPGLVLDPPEHPDDDSDLAGEDDETDFGAGDDV